jgi:hypothetical protein
MNSIYESTAELVGEDDLAEVREIGQKHSKYGAGVLFCQP